MWNNLKYSLGRKVMMFSIEKSGDWEIHGPGTILF